MPMTPEEEAAKKAEDDAKKAAEEKAFNDKVNAAVTARMQRMEKAFEAKLEETLKKFAAPQPPADEPDDEADEPAAEGDKPADKPAQPQTKKVDPTAKKALALAKKAQEEAAAERKKREELENQRLVQEEKLSTKTALEEAGCTGALQRAAMAVLKDDGRIGRDAEGNLVFKTSKRVHGETIIEEEPLADGVKAWLSTDEGKHYLPPKDVAGSGASKGNGGAGGNPKNMSKEQRREAAANTLLKFALGGGR